MRAKDLRASGVEQLHQMRNVLESELLHYVAMVASNAAEAKRRREIRKDLARVLTLLNKK